MLPLWDDTDRARWRGALAGYEASIEARSTSRLHGGAHNGAAC
jgi:hypothetical protein